jgi:hypothetical protein
MRSIRFRFWNKKKKEMLPSSPFYKLDMYHCPFASDLIPLQSTELLDVEGKEIYEGDIVVSHNGAVEGIVKYQAPQFIIQMPRKKVWHEFILAPWERQYQKVIGNIYQDKFLIIQKTKGSARQLTQDKPAKITKGEKG